MPQIRVESNVRPRDSIFLQPWINETFKKYCLDDPNKFRKPIPHIISKLTPEDIKNPFFSTNVMSSPSHFAKITKFYKVDNFKVFAAIRDSEVQLLS